MDNSGTTHKQLDKARRADALFRFNRDSDVSTEVYKCVTWVFRFFQLLCENHNMEAQLCLRKQGLIQLTLDFVDALCGGVASGAGIASLFPSQAKTDLINQTLISLTEYCQGPCPENQIAIATHDSHGIDVCVTLILHDHSPIPTGKLETVLILKVIFYLFLIVLLLIFSFGGAPSDPVTRHLDRIMPPSFCCPQWRAGVTQR